MTDPLADPGPLVRRVYAYVAYRIGAGAEAEDVTGETFERAVRYRSTYDRAKGSPQAWVLGIARACVADYFANRPVVQPHRDEAAGDEGVEGAALERLAVRAAVAQLGERDRELIALRYGADLKAREIADLLGERTNTIEVALHRAVARLRDELDGEEPAGAPRAQPS